eukprot:COSAG03_NODE_5591_length_1214_cov_2.623318_1_plen_39_part_10
MPLIGFVLMMRRSGADVFTIPTTAIRASHLLGVGGRRLR